MEALSSCENSSSIYQAVLSYSPEDSNLKQT
jgi:hypothetical protein